MPTVAARFPERLRGMIDRKLLKLRLYAAFSTLMLLCAIGGSGLGNKRHISEGSDSVKRPKALASPISTGTVTLHRYNFVALEQL